MTLDRSKYVHEGPNGTPRPKGEYSANSRLAHVPFAASFAHVDDDLDFTVGCAAAHPDRRGGQHVAKTCTAVLAVHRATGTAFLSQSERSQMKNKENAIAQLRELLKYTLRSK